VKKALLHPTVRRFFASASAMGAMRASRSSQLLGLFIDLTLRDPSLAAFGAEAYASLRQLMDQLAAHPPLHPLLKGAAIAKDVISAFVAQRHGPSLILQTDARISQTDRRLAGAQFPSEDSLFFEVWSLSGAPHPPSL
jgi:hypothetical protein